MRITKIEGENIILFEDKDDDSGQTKASIGFQTKGGKFTVYMKGYEIDPVEFPSLKGFYGYQLTEEELDTFIDFFESIDFFERMDQKSIDEFTYKCPKCDSANVKFKAGMFKGKFRCGDCGHKWYADSPSSARKELGIQRQRRVK
jgi:ssDNA-binding Zn-finger/Zn-ribbon topoisomerase 1